MSQKQFPTLKWAQRKDKLYITINVVHSKKPIIEIKGKKMKYEGTDGIKNYSFEIELYDEIDTENSKYTLDTRNIFLNLFFLFIQIRNISFFQYFFYFEFSICCHIFFFNFFFGFFIIIFIFDIFFFTYFI